MSDTPRTDAVAEWGKRDFGDRWSGELWGSSEIVPAHECRDIERELAAVTAERDAARAELSRAMRVVEAGAKFARANSGDDDALRNLYAAIEDWESGR